MVSAAGGQEGTAWDAGEDEEEATGGAPPDVFAGSCPYALTDFKALAPYLMTQSTTAVIRKSTASQPDHV